MLRTLKDLLDRLAPPAPGAPARESEHLLQLATAVMLVEVMRADATFHDGEREAVRAALDAVATPATRVGRITEGASLRLFDADGLPVPLPACRGYVHFGGEGA